MDFLFEKELLNVPINFKIETIYIIDNHMSYVSLFDGDMHYLHYVDTDSVGERVMESSSTSEFDIYVIKSNQPVISQSSCFENVFGDYIRIVRTRTFSGNPIVKKPKESSGRDIIVRYKTDRKKLF